MYSSRTDKAHSQNGMSGSDYAWIAFLSRDADNGRHYHRPAHKAETRQIIADEILPDRTVASVFPGLKRIAQATIVRNVANLYHDELFQLEYERVANLNRIEVAFQWREVFLSACEHGCKVYERTNNGVTERQVQHNRTYGCTLSDGPINRYSYLPQTQIEFHAPKRQPVKRYAKPSGFVARPSENRSANLDVETPSLMQMAAARAKNLGITK